MRKKILVNFLYNVCNLFFLKWKDSWDSLGGRNLVDGSQPKRVSLEQIEEWSCPRECLGQWAIPMLIQQLQLAVIPPFLFNVDVTLNGIWAKTSYWLHSQPHRMPYNIVATICDWNQIAASIVTSCSHWWLIMSLFLNCRSIIIDSMINVKHELYFEIFDSQELLRRQANRSGTGISLMYIVIVGVVGIILGYLMKKIWPSEDFIFCAYPSKKGIHKFEKAIVTD